MCAVLLTSNFVIGAPLFVRRMLIAYAYTNAEEEDAGCELAYRRQALRFSYTITPGSRHLMRMRGECACFTVLQSAESRRLSCPDESD